jgi:single-stranded DNA-binding protein
LDSRLQLTNPSATRRDSSKTASNGITSWLSESSQEVCNEYLTKGRQVHVEGRLRTREFEAKNDGGKRQRTEIIASRVQFLGAPPTEKGDASAIEEPIKIRVICGIKGLSWNSVIIPAAMPKPALSR